MAYPVSRKLTRVSGHFGPREPIPLPGGGMSPAFHGGTDFTPLVKGNRIPAYAVGAGTIYGINLGSGAAGLNVMLRLDSDGSLWWYGHLSRIDVTRGQRVRDGQQIGLIGATGNVTGVHLHLERHWPRIDAETDPWPYVKDERDIDGLTSSWQTGNPAVATGDAGSTEEDDMYTDQDRARDDAIYGWLQDVQPKVAQILAIAKRLEVASGIQTWALTDEAAGLRRMVADTMAGLKEVPGATIGEVKLADGEVKRVANAIVNEQATRLQPTAE